MPIYHKLGEIPKKRHTIFKSKNGNYYYEQLFDLEPNILEYDGTFTVLKVEEDTINRKLFYLSVKINHFFG